MSCDAEILVRPSDTARHDDGGGLGFEGSIVLRRHNPDVIRLYQGLNDFFRDTAAEIILIVQLGVICERQYHDGIPADERRGNQAFGRNDFRAFDDWRVSALREFDDDLVFLPFFAVVTSE